MCLVAIYRISATIAPRAEQISWVYLGGALKVKWEQRQSREPATWRKASEIAPVKNYHLSTAAEWHSTVAKAPACSTCSPHIAFLGSGLGSISPVPAAPQSSNSLYQFLDAGKGCSAHRSATFSWIALATEYHLDPLFHNLQVVCVLSFGFSPRNFSKPYSKVTPCLYFSAMFTAVYVLRNSINML